MSETQSTLLLILDDREICAGEVKSLVGARHFGDIIFKRQSLFEHFCHALPDWAKSTLIRLRTDGDMASLRSMLENSPENTAACVIAGRAGFSDLALLAQLIERLPFAQEDFTDSLYRPLVVYLRNAHELVGYWQDFSISPLHTWDKSWHDVQRLQSLQPLDLAKISDFLSFTSGSTATRHFNEVQIDSYYYTKRSSDKRKMQAEYAFYGLVPERMRPWLIQTFDFQDHGTHASYRMMRYYLADAALQWVHGAFNEVTFSSFVERLLFFIAERPQRSSHREQSAALAKEVFVHKLERRAAEFLNSEIGRQINKLAGSASASLDLNVLIERYLQQYRVLEKGFIGTHEAIGHGDPCFSNLLYDQQRYLLKLIDPKGALTENELWMHPLYDLSKISHSVLGDYDFINNGLYKVGFTDDNDMVLHIGHADHAALKKIFLAQVKAAGHDPRVMRLGEASLFLSMLPLHIDYPNKVLAFLLKAREILDEVESGKNW